MNDFERLHDKWIVLAEERCTWCKLGWELGRHGCHYEPVPLGEENDEYESMTENCKAFRLRQCARELSEAITKMSVWFRPITIPEIGTTTVTTGGSVSMPAETEAIEQKRSAAIPKTIAGEQAGGAKL